MDDVNDLVMDANDVMMNLNLKIGFDFSLNIPTVVHHDAADYKSNAMGGGSHDASKSADSPSDSDDTDSAEGGQGGFAWQPRRNNMNEQPPTYHPADYGGGDATERSWERDRDRDTHREHSRENAEDGGTDTEMDAHLMGMYRRGFELQLNKMHYASDAVYEQIMEDISRNGISQSDIYQKYHIDFIPEEASFKLMPPPSLVEDEVQKLRDHVRSAVAHRWRTSSKMAHSQYSAAAAMRDGVGGPHQWDHRFVERKLSDRSSKRAFKNFYALTRMQQKYLGPTSPAAPQQNDSDHPPAATLPPHTVEEEEDDNAVEDTVDDLVDEEEEDFDDGQWLPIRDKLERMERAENASNGHGHGNDHRQHRSGRTSTDRGGDRGYYAPNAPRWGNLTEDLLSDEDIENLNVLRALQETVPLDVLDVLLNDDKIPQWLYESDTILDLNCGVADSLIYLLHNFTTIRGVCAVGSNRLKAKYAALNVAAHGLSERIEVVERDLYDPYIVGRFNVSDVVLLDWFGADEEYFEYLVAAVLNDHRVRAAKLGRVLLSFDRLLFAESTFQASYTLHFAAGWNLEHVQPRPLRHDVSLFMYSIPFYLSKLSNLYVQNYQVFYGFHPLFTDLGFRFDFRGDTIEAANQSRAAWPSWAASLYPSTAQAAAIGPAAAAAAAVDGVHGDRGGNRCGVDWSEHGLDPDLKPSVAGEALLEYVAADYQHLDNAMFLKISAMSLELMDDDHRRCLGEDGCAEHVAREEAVRDLLSTEDEEALFEILSSGMRVSEIGEISEIQKLWNMISDQLLYQSFINGIQRVIRKDVENENSQILIAILNSINQRHLDEAGGRGGADGGGAGGVQHDEWEYLESFIFESHRIDSCALYHYILDEWQLELTALLREFRDLFFYESVRDSVEMKRESLLNCT